MENAKTSWRKRWYDIIFLSDTPEGKLFDILLLVVIVLSVIVVMADSVPSIRNRFPVSFNTLEWLFTIIFTLEYFIRLIVHPKPKKFIFSFYGLIDLLSFIPTYLSLFIAGTHYLIVIRVLRILRIFRVLKLTRYMRASHVLAISLRQSRYKIIVFFEFLLTTVIIMGALMYMVEGPENGFTSIPVGIYWAIVTLTTVGFGDITPSTPLGQFIASLVMILGYSVIAVPTGIISAEIARNHSHEDNKLKCNDCKEVTHENDAIYCRFCGKPLTKRS